MCIDSNNLISLVYNALSKNIFKGMENYPYIADKSCIDKEDRMFEVRAYFNL